jgi:FMN phosphatase YigB (HAD superfamily)
MKIIFDFNRTLYDPDTDALVPGVLELLAELSALGAELHLVSKLEAGREDTLESLGLCNFFTTTAFVEDKEHAIRRIAESSTLPMYVVGDHLHNEIRIGNKYGAKTVWFKRGKFMELKPESEYDVPWRTAGDMKEVRAILFEKG